MDAPTLAQLLVACAAGERGAEACLTDALLDLLPADVASEASKNVVGRLAKTSIYVVQYYDADGMENNFPPHPGSPDRPGPVLSTALEALEEDWRNGHDWGEYDSPGRHHVCVQEYDNRGVNVCNHWYFIRIYETYTELTEVK